MVHNVAECGLWAKNHLTEAAHLVSKYWNQPEALVDYALSTPENRVCFNRFTPKMDEMQGLADLRVKYGLLTTRDQGLVDDRFARTARLDNVTDLTSIMNKP